MSYVVTKKNLLGIDLYWTGQFQPVSRKAIKTRDAALAKQFDTSGEAYEAAKYRRELQDWKVRCLEENLVEWS